MIGGSARPGRLPEGLAAGGDVEMAQDLAASEIRAALTLTRRAALVAQQGQSRQTGGDIRDLESRSPSQGAQGPTLTRRDPESFPGTEEPGDGSGADEQNPDCDGHPVGLLGQRASRFYHNQGFHLEVGLPLPFRVVVLPGSAQ